MTNLTVSTAYNTIVIASGERSDPSKPGKLEFVKQKTRATLLVPKTRVSAKSAWIATLTPSNDRSGRAGMLLK